MLNKSELAIWVGGIFVVLLLGWIIVSQLALRPSTSQTTVGATWEKITIGLSTRRDVHNIYGDPVLPGNSTAAKDEYYITTPPLNEPDIVFIYDSNNIVSYIHISFILPPIEEILQRYGKPQYQVRNVDGYALIYDTQGIIIIVVMKPDRYLNTAIVVDAFLFSPCSIQCIVQSRSELFLALNPTVEPFVLQSTP